MTSPRPDLSHGITKDEHDAWVAEYGRPMTQTPVRKRHDDPADPAQLRTLIDQLIDRLEEERNTNQ